MNSSRASRADVRASGAGICLDNTSPTLITARCPNLRPPSPRLDGRIWAGPKRYGPCCTGSLRPVPSEHQGARGPVCFARFLLLSALLHNTAGWGTSIASAVSRFASRRAGLFQLLGADRTASRQARGLPRLLRPRHVAAGLLQHHLLRSGVRHGPVSAEIHQVGQHPDRLVPLPRLLLVVAVDQHPPSLQGTGPLDQRPSAVGVRVLGADGLTLARRQEQRDQPATARFLDLYLLPGRDE